MLLNEALLLVSSAPRHAPATIARKEIPISPGIYAWYRRGESNPSYLGKATGQGGLRHRIWGQHLNPKYLEWRQDRWTSEDDAQAERGAMHNGRPVIEKSAFRKNLARACDLIPGAHSLEYIKANFEVALIPLQGLSSEQIREIEGQLIRQLQPVLNRSGKGPKRESA